jgi:hypothetical protein
MLGICVPLLLSGCGYKFVGEPKVPSADAVTAIQGRYWWGRPSGADLQHWESFAGAIVYTVPDGASCDVEKVWAKKTISVVTDPAKCRAIPETTPRVLVSGAFQGRDSLAVAFGIGSVDASASLAYDGAVTDIGSAQLDSATCRPANDVILAAVEKDNNKPSNACAVYWVESATMTTYALKTYTSLGSSQNIAGTAFSLKNEIYTSNQGTVTDYRISIGPVLIKSYGPPQPHGIAPSEGGPPQIQDHWVFGEARQKI